jgi:hypothetical protein
MGIGGSNNANLKIPVKVIVKRIDDCLLPDEKDVVLDLLEILELQLNTKRLHKSVSEAFKDNNGVPITLDILRVLIEDDDAVRLGCSIFDLQKTDEATAKLFVQFGGLDLLERVKPRLPETSELFGIINTLSTSILDLGAASAISEIQREMSSLGLCRACQATLERQRRFKQATKDVDIPLASDRINRVTMFMENFSHHVKVQVTGLDAIAEYARNADARTGINDTNVVETVATAMKRHTKVPDVVWRCGIVLSLVCSYSFDSAYDSCRLDLHNLAVQAYPFLDKDVRAQQQLLWYLGQCVTWPRCRNRMQESSLIMDFLKSLMNIRGNLIEQADIKDRFKPYHIVVPLTLRVFLRETKGNVRAKVVEVEPKFEGLKKKDKRAIAGMIVKDEVASKPVYGTVGSKLYGNGEVGLISETEQEKLSKISALEKQRAEAAKPDMPDWETKLQYGLKKGKGAKDEVLLIEDEKEEEFVMKERKKPGKGRKKSVTMAIENNTAIAAGGNSNAGGHGGPETLQITES